MGMRNLAAAPAAVLALGLLLLPPASIPAQSQPTALTKPQADALATYTEALNNFKSILSARRAQIDSKQPLP